MSDQKEIKSKLEKSIVLKNFLCHQQQHVGRNMNIKGASSEVSEKKKKLVIGHQMTIDIYYKVAVNLAELSSSVAWEVYLVTHELRYLTNEIPTKLLNVYPYFSLCLQQNARGKT